MQHLRDAGAYASEIEGIVNFTLAVTFGGRAGPSAWEPHSAAIEKLFNREAIEEQPDPSRLARFVDDLLLSMAFTTWNGTPDGSERMRKAITWVVNRDGINCEKSQAFKSIVNAFGEMIDTYDREVSTPWSKILKLGHAVEPLLT